MHLYYRPLFFYLHPATTDDIMDYAIAIKLTKKQYHFLHEMARSEHRTLGNCFSMLAAEGIRYYGFEHTLAIRKREEDKTDKEKQVEYYDSDEIEEVFSSIPLIQ